MEASACVRSSGGCKRSGLKLSRYLLTFFVWMHPLTAVLADDIDPTLQAVLNPEPTIESSETSSAAEPLELPRVILGSDRLRAEAMEEVAILFFECVEVVRLVILDSESPAVPPYPFEGVYYENREVETEVMATQRYLESLCARIALPWADEEIISEDMSMEEISKQLDLLAGLLVKVLAANDEKGVCEYNALREYHLCLEQKRFDCDDTLHQQMSLCQDAYVRELAHTVVIPVDFSAR